MTTAAKLEEVYTDFLMGMASAACRNGIETVTNIRPFKVRGFSPEYHDATGPTLADALYALLTDLGAHPPERVTEEEVRAWWNGRQLESAGDGTHPTTLRNLKRAAASDDPRERLMAASILVVGP